MNWRLLQFDLLALAGLSLQSLLLRDVIRRLPALPVGRQLLVGGLMALPLIAYLLFRIWGIVFTRRHRYELPFETVGMFSGSVLSLAVITGFSSKMLFWLAIMEGLLAWRLISQPERYDDRRAPREKLLRLSFLRSAGGGHVVTAVCFALLGLLNRTEPWVPLAAAPFLLAGPVVGAIRGTPRY